MVFLMENQLYSKINTFPDKQCITSLSSNKKEHVPTVYCSPKGKKLDTGTI